MAIVQKVRTTILAHHLLPRGETVIVAVSGGPDSLALLHLLHSLSSELTSKLHVAHLNHQLRGAKSDADASFVGETATSMGLPATIEARNVAEYGRDHHLSPEEAARVIRYRFLAEVARTTGSRTIAVGHNADDQVETVIMHWLRGAGLAGMRGMTYKAHIPYAESHIRVNGSTLDLVRPLLDVERLEIESYCRESGLTPRFDETNLDTSFFRNRIRREVIPYLEQLNPNLREVVRHSASALADDYDYLHSVTGSAFDEIAVPEIGATLPADLARVVFDREKWQALPPSLQRATLREAIRRLRRGLRNINWAHIEDARRVGCEKGVGAEATLPQGLVLVVGYHDLTIGETVSFPNMPLLHADVLELQRGARLELPESGWQVRVEEEQSVVGMEKRRQFLDAKGNNWVATLDADRIRGRMRLRTRRSGERFEPLGLEGRHKSLHEFMIEEKIPRHVRDLLPILVDDEKILWVCGYRIDERVKVTEKTRRSLEVEFFKDFESE